MIPEDKYQEFKKLAGKNNDIFTIEEIKILSNYIKNKLKF